MDLCGYYMQIVYADVSPLWEDELYEKIYNQIPKWRKEKADAYKVKKAKCLSVGASFLFVYTLRQMGREDLIDKVVFSDNGKPYFEGEKTLFFNMSHSESMAMCVFSDAAVGGDIQYCQKDVKGIADRFYTAGERQYMYNTDDGTASEMDCDADIIRDRFYRIWTRKESYIKLTGEGLSKSFDSFDVFGLDCDFVETKIDDYRICVASYNESTPVITCFTDWENR